MSSMHIGSEFDFENLYNSVTIDSGQVLRFLARNPGIWGNKVEIAIANPEDYGSNKHAFKSIDLDGMFEYYPDAENHEVGVIIKCEGEIKEMFLCSLDKDSRDMNNKSNFIENVLNRQSNIVFCKYVGNAEEGITSCLYPDTVKLSNGTYEEISQGDILTAYELWDNKEEVDVDIVIGNEKDDGNAAFALAERRKDCVAFIGTQYNIVGLRAAQATMKTVENRGDRNSMFACYAGNYKYQYDKLSVA